MARFTNAPLPSLKLLRKSLLRRSKPRDSFLDSWRTPNHLIVPLSRSAWSLKLIADYKLIQSKRTYLNFLVPSYFCNSSLAPLREMKTNLVFYPIQKDGTPNMDEVNKILLEKKIDIIVGVHFFGSFMDFTELSHIAREKNIWLVEDFAHILNVPDKDRIKSDFQMFSPHKFLPISDGALLMVNKNIFMSEAEERNFIDLYNSSPFVERSFLKGYFWLFKRLLQKLNIGIHVGIKDFVHDEYINTSDGFFKPGMTNMSKSLLSVLTNFLEQNKILRKENAQAWMSLVLYRYPSAKILFAKENTESIYLLGFEFSDLQELDEALTWFNLKEFPICTWPDLPEEVLQNKDYFKNSIDLRNRCIFFQVHSSIDKKHIESSN